jgi:DNA polymerase-3 subunit delta
MRLKPDQLNTALQRSLAPVYLITGDEPLQAGELADAIRKAARKQGYEAREVLSVETGFTWGQLAFSTDSMSIFSEKKLIDLRVPSGTPGADGSKALTRYCERLPEDTVLLITAGKIASAAYKSHWLELLDKTGVIIQVWPLEGQDLVQWLQKRMQQRGLITNIDGAILLASRIEGNLLAAAQEVEKLFVLYGEGEITLRQIQEVVADSTRYDVFKLIDALLAGNVERIIKILYGLQIEGIAAPIVLWGLTREARTLIKIHLAFARGENKDLVYKNNQIWGNRRQLMDDALKRMNLTKLNKVLATSAIADRQIKGQQQGDSWETLLEICLIFTSLHKNKQH